MTRRSTSWCIALGLLLLAVGGCGSSPDSTSGSASGSTGGSSSASGGSATATATAARLPASTSMPEFRPSHKQIGSDAQPPQAIVGGDGSDGGGGAPVTAEPYWASDGRHYVVVDGAWAYDYFMAAQNDTNGQPVPGEIGIYRATDNVEAFVFDTNLDGYIAFRDLSNPLFNVVHWVAWPSGQPATATNMFYKVTVDQSTFAWFDQTDFSNIVNSGLGQRIGFDQPAPMTLWEDWTQHATNTNGVLFGQSLNHTWVQPNCAYGCITY